jgi:hypothetical protein
MRRYLLIFMLFLLPIRGLVGDAMAYSMLPGALTAAHTAQSVATNVVAAPAVFQWTTAASDHENRAESASVHPCHMAVAQTDSNDTVQNQCTACQACHLSAATPLQLPRGLLQIASALPEQRQALWHSAEPRWIAKTPVF